MRLKVIGEEVDAARVEAARAEAKEAQSVVKAAKGEEEAARLQTVEEET